MAKIMKDTAQEQALLEVADLLQQLKILDNSTKNPESSLSCTYRVAVEECSAFQFQKTIWLV